MLSLSPGLEPSLHGWCAAYPDQHWGQNPYHTAAHVHCIYLTRLLRLCCLSPVRYVQLWREPRCFLTCTWSWCPHSPSCSGGHSGFWWPEQNEPSESHRSPIWCRSPCLCFSHTLPCIWPARGQHFSTSTKTHSKEISRFSANISHSPFVDALTSLARSLLALAVRIERESKRSSKPLSLCFSQLLLYTFYVKKLSHIDLIWFDLIGKLRTKWKDTFT